MSEDRRGAGYKVTNEEFNIPQTYADKVHQYSTNIQEPLQISFAEWLKTKDQYNNT